jgi:hypothetical protein
MTRKASVIRSSGVTLFLDLFRLGRGSILLPICSHAQVLDFAWELVHKTWFCVTHLHGSEIRERLAILSQSMGDKWKKHF